MTALLSSPSAWAALAVLAALAALATAVNHRFLRLPPTVGAMAVSLAASLALAGLAAANLDGGLSARERGLLEQLDFPTLMLQGLLSMLLFAGALQVDVGAMRERRGPVIGFAAAGTAASTFLVGVGLHAALAALSLDVPIAHCLVFGALISPTDPIAVIAMLRSARAPRALEAVIAGESLFNDGVGVVLFAVLLETAGRIDAGAHGAVVAQAGVLLLREAGGGLAFGWLMGRAMAWALARIASGPAACAVSLAAVLAGYALADEAGLSGPLAVVVAGLACSPVVRAHAARTAIAHFWERLDEALNALLFALVGMEVVVVRVPQGVGAATMAAAMAAAVAVALAARWLTAGLPMVLLPRAFGLPRGAAALLTWGGLRGGLSLAMALALPAGMSRDLLVALCYAVVAFAILVQGATFARLVRAQAAG